MTDLTTARLVLRMLFGDARVGCPDGALNAARDRAWGQVGRPARGFLVNAAPTSRAGRAAG